MEPPLAAVRVDAAEVTVLAAAVEGVVIRGSGERRAVRSTVRLPVERAARPLPFVANEDLLCAKKLFMVFDGPATGCDGGGNTGRGAASSESSSSKYIGGCGGGLGCELKRGRGV